MQTPFSLELELEPRQKQNKGEEEKKWKNSESGEETRHGFALIFEKSSYFIQSKV